MMISSHWKTKTDFCLPFAFAFGILENADSRLGWLAKANITLTANSIKSDHYLFPNKISRFVATNVIMLVHIILFVSLLMLLLLHLGTSIFLTSLANVDADSFDVTAADIRDVLISDFKEEHLFLSVSGVLNCPHLEPSGGEVSGFPWRGRMVGTQYRQFLCLQVKVISTHPYINVISLVDSGAYHTFFSNTTMVALGYREPLPLATGDAVINGMPPFEVYLSPRSENPNFGDLNILGAGFLAFNGLVVESDYVNREFTIRKGVYRSLKSDEF
jgi:hypothetical protein